MRTPVIAIMLDSLEPAWLERTIAAGRLPTLARLRAESARATLHGIHPFTGELPTHALLTSTHPARAGYWGAFNYDAATGKPVYARAYDYRGIRSFYDYSPGLKVCQFDVPKAGLATVAEGIQVLNWGAHGSLNDSVSNPPELYGELQKAHGLHPALERDHLEPWQSRGLADLFGRLIAGVRLRSQVHRDLLGRADWDLFFTSYSEMHSGAHCFMHLDDPSYPLHDGAKAGTHMLTIAGAIDASIADLLRAAPPDAAIAVFSVHGMVNNGWDINTMYLLPELLHRLHFPVRIRRPDGPPPPASVGSRMWAQSVWRLTFGAARRPPAIGEGINFIPATWYAADWPRMTAFAIPGLDEGMVRINVKGRDAAGRVDPAQYETVLAKVAHAIASLTDARTGRPLVSRFFRTRRDPLEDGPHLPPADLIVEWTQEACDVADSPVAGRIGPVPLRRTGGHSRNGFVWFRDPRLAPGDRLAATPYDLGPTMLDLIGVDLPGHFDGRSLLRDWSRRADRAMFPTFEPRPVAVPLPA